LRLSGFPNDLPHSEDFANILTVIALPSIIHQMPPSDKRILRLGQHDNSENHLDFVMLCILSSIKLEFVSSTGNTILIFRSGQGNKRASRYSESFGKIVEIPFISRRLLTWNLKTSVIGSKSLTNWSEGP
jgi:hypothetical protein